MDHEKRFELLSNILRASHFEWRRAALATCPDVRPIDLVKRYWQEVGVDTARFYLSKIDPERDLADQVADLFVSSSIAMGEDAETLDRGPDGRARARHNACPWFDWHRRQGLLEEDQPGCDHWLATVVGRINEALGRSLRFETHSSLPAGGDCCLRSFWEEDR